MVIQPHQFKTYSLSRSRHGDDICSILASAIRSADAGNAIKRHVHCDSEFLIVDNVTYQLSKFNGIYVIGAGKATAAMVSSIHDILGNRITAGFAITKEGYLGHYSSQLPNNIKILEAGHPTPDPRNLEAGKQLLSFIENITSLDLVIILLSGGGSSLLMEPASGISLVDIQSSTNLLLNSGASIHEINTIRKHLDIFKGGGLASILYPATVVTLILSDVVGDNLAVIASGPTVPDTTSFEDAWEILQKYNLLERVPTGVITRIISGIHGEIRENSSPDDSIFKNVTNIIVGNNSLALSGAIDKADSLGYTCHLAKIPLIGEASVVGDCLAKEANSLFQHPASIAKPACLLAGGETTVTIKGNGKGGRNQELALASVMNLAGPSELILVSLATDGGDGPTDAAGAVVTNSTYARSLDMKIDTQSYLARNDSYHYFELLGDLIKIGPTFTNVNDLVFIFAL